MQFHSYKVEITLHDPSHEEEIKILLNGTKAYLTSSKKGTLVYKGITEELEEKLLAHEGVASLKRLMPELTLFHR